MRQLIQIACWNESRWKVVLEFLILKLANMWGRGVGDKAIYFGAVTGLVKTISHKNAGRILDKSE